MAVGVILAGGTSRRMGIDKAVVDVAGRPMIEWVADALMAVCDSVIVAGRDGLLSGLQCFPDGRPSVRGPLAGLATGLALGGDRVLVLGVDQPFVEVRTLERLLALPGSMPVVPIDEQRQVTCAVYPAALLPEAERETKVGGSIQSLLDRVRHRSVIREEWTDWGEDGRSWFSVDTPEDLAVGLARWGPPG